MVKATCVLKLIYMYNALTGAKIVSTKSLQTFISACFYSTLSNLNSMHTFVFHQSMSRLSEQPAKQNLSDACFTAQFLVVIYLSPLNLRYLQKWTMALVLFIRENVLWRSDCLLALSDTNDVKIKVSLLLLYFRPFIVYDKDIIMMTGNNATGIYNIQKSRAIQLFNSYASSVIAFFLFMLLAN